MTRSIWKGPFVSSVFFRQAQKKKLHNVDPIKIYSRSSFILPQFVGQKFSVYNGQTFIPVQITEDMVGHKFGEFSLTKKKTIHKKTLKNKK